MSDALAKAHYKTYGGKEGRLYKLENPEDFDPVKYKSYHPDLQHMTDMEASVHYTQWGKKEGRQYNEYPVCAPISATPITNKSLYIVITTVKGQEIALDCIVESLPSEWKRSYIVVSQKEDCEDCKVCEDGHIEVRLNRNIYEYGAWIGVQMLIEKNVIPPKAWCLFVHDTCCFGANSQSLTERLASKFDPTPIDCIWLCKHGLRNICLIRRHAIREGAKRYERILTMTNDEAIQGELNSRCRFSPKSLYMKQDFLHFPLSVKEKRKVYGIHMRNVEYFESIDLERYVIPTNASSSLPRSVSLNPKTQ